MSKELIETQGAPSVRFFTSDNSKGRCDFTIFNDDVVIENHSQGLGVELSLNGKRLVGIWGYHLPRKKGVLIRTKCGEEHRIEPDQEVTEIYVDGKKVYAL